MVRLTYPAFAFLLLLSACGPAAEWWAIDDYNRPKPRTTLGLTVELAEFNIIRPGCSLARRFRYEVNLAGVSLEYSINDSDPIDLSGRGKFIAPNSPTLKDITLLADRENKVVFTATLFGHEPDTKTVTVNLTGVRPPGALPLLVTSKAPSRFVLRWAAQKTVTYDVYHAPFNPAKPPLILSDLASKDDRSPKSPLTVKVRDLQKDPAGLIAYEFPPTSALWNTPQWFAFGIRTGIASTNPGCKSKIVVAHTSPRPFEGQWSSNMPGTGSISTVPSDELPPLLLDRGGDLNAGVRGPDAATDIVLFDSRGEIRTLLNMGSRGFRDATDPITLGFDLEAPPIRAFAVHLDKDTTPDLIAATASKIFVLLGDNDSGPLKFKSIGTGIKVPSANPNHVFLDVNHGDFNGDQLTDVVASVGDSKTKQAHSFWVWFASLDEARLAVRFGESDRMLVWDIAGSPAEDGRFLVGDFNSDGFTDILHRAHGLGGIASGRRTRSPAVYQFVTYLVRGKSLPVKRLASDIDVVNGAVRFVQWDHSRVVDLNHDGFPDLLTSGIDPDHSGTRTNIVAGYLNDGNGRIDGSSQSFRKTVRTSPSCRSTFGFEDLDGDGLIDIVQRETRGSFLPLNEIQVYLGRPSEIGTQDWSRFRMPSGGRFAGPSVPYGRHFAIGDLNSDGIADFCANHRIGRLWTPIVLESSSNWRWDPVLQGVAGGGSSSFGDARETMSFPGNNDRVIGVEKNKDGEYHVEYLRLRRDSGVRAGGFGTLLRTANIIGMPDSPVEHFVQTAVSTGPAEVVTLLDNRQLGTINWDARAKRPRWRSSASGPKFDPKTSKLFAARTNFDRYGDAILWDKKANQLYLYTTVQGRLTLSDLTDLAHSAEFVEVLDLGTHGSVARPIEVRDGLSDVAVVFGPDNRELQIFVTSYTENNVSPALVRMFDPSAVKPSRVPQQIVSITAANFRATKGVDEDHRISLIAGTAKGDLYQFELGQRGPSPARLHPQITPVGDGNIYVRSADMNNDGVPDLIVHDEKAGHTRVYENLLDPDPKRPWKRTGKDAFRLAGEIDMVGLSSLFGILHVNDDVYPDVVFLREDNRSLETFLGVGYQR